MSQTPSIRYDFLDWLRVIAIGILFFFHTGMLFVGWGFHLQNAEVIESLRLPMDLSHRLRMPLLFVVAGAALWYAARRRNWGELLKERGWRLGVPVVFGMLIIVPPQIYVERLWRGAWEGGYMRFYLERVLQFEPYPQGNFSWHHLWFIVYLLVYVPLLLPAIAVLKRSQTRASPGVWLLALALPLALNEALLKPLFPESHALLDDWYVFNHYLLLTAYGVLLARMDAAWDWLAQHRNRLLVAALGVTIVGLSLLENDIVRRDTPGDALIANVFTWSWLLSFLAFGRQYLSIDNRFLQWAKQASYPFYILHQTVLLVIAYWIIAMPWSAWTKFWCVLIATFAVCYVLYETLVRRFDVMRWLFGMRRRRAINLKKPGGSSLPASSSVAD